jgi:outer membrane lipoprotein-sorting protein
MSMLLLFSCAPRKVIKPPPTLRSPEEVLDSLKVKGSNIESYAADMVVGLHSEKLDLSFDMELYYREPSEIAFTFEMLLGIDVARAVLRNDTLRAYSPFRNAYFEQELRGGRFMEFGDIEFDLVSNIDFSVGKFGFRETGTTFLGKDEGLYLYETTDTSWEKRFWVNPATVTVAKSHWRHREDPYDLWINYYDFHKVGGGWRPGRITLYSQDKGFRTQIRIRQEKINIEIPDRFFELQIPEDAKRIEPQEGHPPR